MNNLILYFMFQIFFSKNTHQKGLGFFFLTAVKWLKYWRYGLKSYTINQSILTDEALGTFLIIFCLLSVASLSLCTFKFSSLILLQNRWANFNQTWHKASMGEGYVYWLHCTTFINISDLVNFQGMCIVICVLLLSKNVHLYEVTFTSYFNWMVMVIYVVE